MGNAGRSLLIAWTIWCLGCNDDSGGWNWSRDLGGAADAEGEDEDDGCDIPSGPSLIPGFPRLKIYSLGNSHECGGHTGRIPVGDSAPLGDATLLTIEAQNPDGQSVPLVLTACGEDDDTFPSVAKEWEPVIAGYERHKYFVNLQAPQVSAGFIAASPRDGETCTRVWSSKPMGQGDCTKVLSVETIEESGSVKFERLDPLDSPCERLVVTSNTPRRVWERRRVAPGAESTSYTSGTPSVCIDNDSPERGVFLTTNPQSPTGFKAGGRLLPVGWDEFPEEGAAPILGMEPGDWWSIVLPRDEARGASILLEPVLGLSLEWPCIAFSTKLVVRASCVSVESPTELSEVGCDECNAVWQNEGMVAVGCGPMRSREDLVVPTRALDIPHLEGCTDEHVLVHIGVLRMQYPPEEMGTCGACQLRIGADVCFEYQITLVRSGT